MIGSFSGTTTLVVSLNGNATPQAVQALLRSITFRTTAISTIVRTVQVSLTDGDGAVSNQPTKLINVNASNVAPTISSLGSGLSFDLSFYTNPTLVAPSTTVLDPDTVNFSNGQLKVETVNAQPQDRLTIRDEGAGPGKVRLVGDNVLFGGVVVGTKSGGDGLNTLVVTFNEAAQSNVSGVQSILRNVQWSTTSLQLGIRNISVVLTDGDGGTSNVQTTALNSIRSPHATTISNLGAQVNYTASSGTAIRVAASASITEHPFTDYNNGVLVFSTIENAEATDLFSVRNEGVGTGQIGINGTNVTYSGIIIGTVTGGSGLSPMSITLNANATHLSVEKLLRMVTWKSTVNNPTTSPRKFQVTLTTDGQVSTPVTKLINVA
ncbi:MAG: hypothetical protein U0930_22140 [Pirellulales bacterium]